MNFRAAQSPWSISRYNGKLVPRAIYPEQLIQERHVWTRWHEPILSGVASPDNHAKEQLFVRKRRHRSAP